VRLKALLGVAMASLCLVPALACEMNCGSVTRRAKEKGEQGGLAYVIKAQAVRTFGFDIVGIPHAPVFFPVVKGAEYGYELRVALKEREAVVFHQESTPALKSATELEAISHAVEVKVSPDRAHIALRPRAGAPWIAFHLLPRGVPFLSHHSKLQDQKSIPWNTLPAPMTILGQIISKLEARLGEKDLEQSLYWRAAREQPEVSDAWSIVAPLWPRYETTHAPMMTVLHYRCTQETDCAAKDSFSRQILSRAVQKLGRESFYSAPALRAVDALSIAGSPAQLDAMDQQLLGHWKTAPRFALECIGRRLDRVRRPMRLFAPDQGNVSRLLKGLVGKGQQARASAPPTAAWYDEAARLGMSALGEGHCARALAGALLLSRTHGNKYSSQVIGALLRYWPGNPACSKQLEALAAGLGSSPADERDRRTLVDAARTATEASSAERVLAGVRLLKLLKRTEAEAAAIVSGLTRHWATSSACLNQLLDLLRAKAFASSQARILRQLESLTRACTDEACRCRGQRALFAAAYAEAPCTRIATLRESVIKTCSGQVRPRLPNHCQDGR
jgi:hypothetical protein